MARERGFDLVEVAPQAQPPVCKMMDFSKWKYEQSKRLKEARKKQKTQDVKEVKMRPTIDEHDFNVKARACQKFLSQGDKVKATIMFRGRELAHIDLGQKILERLLEYVKDICTVEKPVSYTHLDVYKRQPYTCRTGRGIQCVRISPFLGH